MSIGDWLKTHRRQLSVHVSIILVFALFTALTAEPLFDRLERIPGEAHLHRIQLPAATNDIVSFVDHCYTDGSTAVEVQGWAFIDGHDSADSEVYIVLRSGRRTYVFDTMVRMRPDITLLFEDLNLDLDYSGFFATIPARRIRDGRYNMGLYIKKGDAEALQYVDNSVVKSRGSITCTFMVSTSQKIRLPAASQNVRIGIDVVEAVGQEDEFTYIGGWAFIEDRDIETSRIYVVLKSDSATYVFDAIQFERHDVAAAFFDSGWNVKQPGFKARITRQQVRGGDYLLGIYIRKGDIDALSYTDRRLRFQPLDSFRIASDPTPGPCHPFPETGSWLPSGLFPYE